MFPFHVYGEADGHGWSLTLNIWMNASVIKVVLDDDCL